MTTLELITYFSQGREIEFSLKGHNYFLQPLYSDDESNKEYQYVLYDCINPNNLQAIFQGSVNDIKLYLFENKYNFENHLSVFDFTCIL